MRNSQANIRKVGELPGNHDRPDWLAAWTFGQRIEWERLRFEMEWR